MTYKLFLFFRFENAKGFRQVKCRNLCELFQLSQEIEKQQHHLYKDGDHPVAMREDENGNSEFAYLMDFPLIDWEYKYKECE